MYRAKGPLLLLLLSCASRRSSEVIIPISAAFLARVFDCDASARVTCEPSAKASGTSWPGVHSAPCSLPQVTLIGQQTSKIRELNLRHP